MPDKKYHAARTLARKIRAFPKQGKAQFKANRAVLRKHFEQFNKDASDMCSWIMAINPNSKKYPNQQPSEPFWKFFLEPAKDGTSEDVKDGDKQRLRLMDYILGVNSTPPVAELKESIEFVKSLKLKATAIALFERLKLMQPTHRLVLFKAAAEWVVARYWRQRESWEERTKIWNAEKADWEKKHPELTESIRDRFNHIFKNLRQKSEGDNAKDLKRKTPRICLYKDMKEGHPNCAYAGQRVGGVAHDPLCKNFLVDFTPKSLDGFEPSSKAKNHNKNIPRDNLARFHHLAEFIVGMVADGSTLKEAREAFRQELKSPKEKLDSPRPNRKDKNENHLLDRDNKLVESCSVFMADYMGYINALGMTEQNLITKFKSADNKLPHCATAHGVDGVCRFNQHTKNCDNYRLALDDHKDLQQFDEIYREWRKHFLAGPKRPVFKYPSAKNLPRPKIIGDGFWKADFENSTISLQTETGEWLKFGFDPWPRKYIPSRAEVAKLVTSVQVSFLGNRARAGFRFGVEHKVSRINATQTEIDDLRSHDFPSASNDEKYLAAVLKLVTEKFTGDAEGELRVLNVDLGNSEAGWALTVGKNFGGDIKNGGLPIVKVLSNKLLEQFPKGKDAPDSKKGLNNKHVLRHQEDAAERAQKIVKYRQEKAEQELERKGATSKAKLNQTAFNSDQRGLFIHINRMVRDWVRLMVSQIMKVAERLEADVIVVDGSRRPMAKGYNEADANALAEKQRKAYRAFGQIRHKLREKAVEKGMRVVTVPEEGTSSVCYSCGKKGKQNKTARIFTCCNEECPVKRVKKLNTEKNAALVLGRVFWGDSQPYKDKDKKK